MLCKLPILPFCKETMNRRLYLIGEIHFLLTRLLTLYKREERAETPAGFEQWNPGSLGDRRKEEVLCRKAI